MPDVIFEEQKISQRQREEMRQTSSFANWLIKIGVVKTEKEAVLFSLAFFVLAAVIVVFMLFNSNIFQKIERNGSGPSEKELQEYKKIQPF